MKRFLMAFVAATAVSPAFSADVGALGGLSYYGQIDIHRASKPDLIFPEPVVVRQVDVVTPGEPVYMRVPADHAKNWRKHCQKYNACDQRVLFVEDKWYTNVYAPEYKKSDVEKP